MGTVLSTFLRTLSSRASSCCWLRPPSSNSIWALSWSFYPTRPYAYFPKYTWVALLILWIVMMVIGNLTRSDGDGEPQS